MQCLKQLQLTGEKLLIFIYYLCMKNLPEELPELYACLLPSYLADSFGNQEIAPEKQEFQPQGFSFYSESQTLKFLGLSLELLKRTSI